MKKLFVIADNSVSLSFESIQYAFWAESKKYVELYVKVKIATLDFFEEYLKEGALKESQVAHRKQRFELWHENHAIDELEEDCKLFTLNQARTHLTNGNKKIEIIDLCLTDSKKSIFEFIKSTVSVYDFERQKEENLKYGFRIRSYHVFLDYQRLFLALIDNEEVGRLNTLIFMINRGLKKMDKECMVAFPVTGFGFDMNGELIIFNDR